MGIRRAKCCGNCAHADLIEDDTKSTEQKKRFNLCCIVRRNVAVDELSVCDVFEQNQQETD